MAHEMEEAPFELPEQESSRAEAELEEMVDVNWRINYFVQFYKGYEVAYICDKVNKIVH